MDFSILKNKIFHRNFYDFKIFTQPFRAVCLERLCEYCDVIEIFVDYLIY